MKPSFKAALPRGAARSLVAGTLALACASPALADHTGPTGVGSSGGGIDVQGPETLEAGHFAVGAQAKVTVPRDRPDAELVALAARHIHAHTGDYTLNAAVGAAYGVTDRLTISAELRRPAGQRQRSRRCQPAGEIWPRRRSRRADRRGQDPHRRYTRARAVGRTARDGASAGHR